MKFLTKLIFYCTPLITSTLAFASTSLSQAFFFEDLDQAVKDRDIGEVWTINAHALQTGHYDMKSPSNVNGQKMHFLDTEIDLACCMIGDVENLVLGAGFEFFDLTWKNNPYFQQHCFPTIDLGILLTTSRFQNWFWQAGFSDRLDINHHGSANYSQYNTQVWGRYSYCDWGFHIGTLLIWGLKNFEAYPIVGFDWENSSWVVSAVYPTDISVAYKPNCHWSVGAATRFFKARYRTDKSDNSDVALFVNKNTGAEVFAKYTFGTFTAKGFLGIGFNGSIKVMDSSGDKIATNDYNRAGYGGVNLSLAF